MKLERRPFTGVVAFLIVLFAMPVGHAGMILVQVVLGRTYQFAGAVALGIIGFVALLLSLRFKGETARTALGLLAGVLMWTGFVEFTYVYYAMKLGIRPEMANGAVVTKPEYLVMPSSVGLVASLMACLLLNGQTRCNFFMWIRRQLRMRIEFTSNAKTKNYAVVTAMETIFVLWFTYILMMVVYSYGDREWPTWAMLFGCLLWSLYLIVKLLRHSKLGPALRYAVPTVIIFWMCVEVLGRWDFFTEIWARPTEYLLEMGLITAALVGAIALVRFLPDRAREKGQDGEPAAEPAKEA
jgi:hypothetical protein